MIVYGINSVMEALRNSARHIARLYLRSGRPGKRLREIIELARNSGVPVRFENPAVLERKAGSSRHQGAVAELAEIAYQSLDTLLSIHPDFLLMIDGVEDPHNFGAVLRTAEATGVGGVLVPHRNSCGVTPAVVKASAGAALLVPIVQIGNLVQTLQALKEFGFWSAGLEMDGDTLPWQLDASLPLVLVVGSEGRGLRPLVKKQCDFLVGLPMSGKISSLNLSVAAGILMFEVASQRIRRK